MEKVFELERRELAAFASLEQEKTTALAAYGALSMDIENAKKTLEMILEKQRTLVRAALNNRGVDQFEGARLSGQSIIVTMNPQLVPSIPQEQVPDKEVKSTNGLAE